MSSRDRTLLIATVTIWLIAWAVWTTAWVYGDMRNDLTERALRRVLTCSFGTACCWVMKNLLDRARGRAILARMALAGLFCLGAAPLYALVNRLVFYTIAPRWGSSSFNDLFDVAELAGFLFLAWTGLYFGIDADAEARDSRLRLAAAETEALFARNRALVQQMNPHFLFNALNTLSGLILERDVDRAERMTTALAGLLRRSLEIEPREYVPLHEELDAVRRYLEIEQNRFEARLVVEEQVEPGLENHPIPPMIVQPLVENAVKHGVARSTGLVRLTIEVRSIESQLVIKVTDDARSAADASVVGGSGIGHENIRRRLALLYGLRASLTCSPRPSGGFSATIVIPADPDGLA